MKNEKINIQFGGTFASLLTIAFIVLKLCNVINWSWVWVLAPMWISILFALVLVIVIVAVIYKNGRIR